MSEKRICEGCGKEYWWPTASWQHEKCSPATAGSSFQAEVSETAKAETSGGQSAATGVFDRKSYQRDYMRKYRKRGKPTDSGSK